MALLGVYPLAQGATFAVTLLRTSAAGLPMALTGSTLRSQIRRRDTDALLAECVVTILDQVADPGRYTLTVPAAGTLAWPIGTVYGDIEVITGSVRDHLGAFAINVTRPQTRPA